MAGSSANDRSWSASTHTVLAPSHSTPNRPLLPAGLPSRLRSLPSSPPRRGSRSFSTPNRKVPADGAQVAEAVVAVADRGAHPTEGTGYGASRIRAGGDEYGDRLLTGGPCLREPNAVLFGQTGLVRCDGCAATRSDGQRDDEHDGCGSDPATEHVSPRGQGPARRAGHARPSGVLCCFPKTRGRVCRKGLPVQGGT